MTQQHELEDGFYWVRRRKWWMVAEYQYGAFWLAGDAKEYEVSWPDEIDPRPITREKTNG